MACITYFTQGREPEVIEATEYYCRSIDGTYENAVFEISASDGGKREFPMRRLWDYAPDCDVLEIEEDGAVHSVWFTSPT